MVHFNLTSLVRSLHMYNFRKDLQAPKQKKQLIFTNILALEIIKTLRLQGPLCPTRDSLLALHWGQSPI